MDFKAFSDEDFDEVKWINDCFRKDAPEKNQRESYSSNIVYKLQLFVQELNSSLEETASEVIQNVSKVKREAAVIADEAKALKEEIAKVQAALEKSENSSETINRTLKEYDAVKVKLQESCKALREADNWTTLSADVEQIFESGNLDLISSKIIGMQQSLDMLNDVPDYHVRLSRLEDLKDRFERLAMQKVIASFSSSSVEGVSTYVKMFQRLRRTLSLVRVYKDFHRNHLITEWEKVIATYDATEEPLAPLSMFGDSLTNLWITQSEFCFNVLFNGNTEETMTILSDIVIEVLANLDSGICSYLQSAFESTKNNEGLKESLEFLIEVKQQLDRLCKALEVNILSFNNGEVLMRKPQFEIMVTMLYSAYREMICLYPLVEEELLLEHLNNIKKNLDLGSCVSKLFMFGREAERRNYLLTNSTALPGYVDAIEKYFIGFLRQFDRSLLDLQQKSENSYTFTDSSHHFYPNWEIFQKSLFLLQAIGDFKSQASLFDEQLRNTCMERANKMNDNVNILQRHHDLLLNTSLKEALDRFIAKTLKSDSENFTVLVLTQRYCKDLCAKATEIVLLVAMKFIEMHLNNMSNDELKSVAEKESSSLASDEQEIREEKNEQSFTSTPREYITQIGQYLLTLPQHIEPFTLQENTAFKLALKCGLDALDEAITAEHSVISVSSTTSNVTESLLQAIARKVCNLYASSLLSIQNMTIDLRKQLIVDLEYTNEVFEDLGIVDLDRLPTLLKVLKAKQLDELSSIKDNDEKLYNSIKRWFSNN